MDNFRSSPIKLNESIFSDSGEGVDSKIQVLRTGTFRQGKNTFEITEKQLQEMVKNFQERARGIDIMLDFSHKSEGEAAAWFNELYLSEDGQELWADVKWTEGGEESVRKKKFRYISADFSFNHQDNETGESYGPVLFGAGLTNRPVVKNMKPLILSEEKPQQSANGESMQKELDELKKANLEKDKQIKALTEKLSSFAKNDKNKEIEEKEKALAEREEAIRLSEEKIEKDKVMTEKKESFDKLLSEGKAVEAQRESFMNDDMAGYAANAVDPKTLNLSEQGNSGNNSDNVYKDSKTPAQDEVIALSEKEEKEISVILSENPKLAARYAEEVETEE